MLIVMWLLMVKQDGPVILFLVPMPFIHWAATQCGGMVYTFQATQFILVVLQLVLVLTVL